MAPNGRAEPDIENTIHMGKNMADTTAPVIRTLEAADETRWRSLFRAYREFYKLEESEEIVSRAWGWLMDPRHECKAIVATVGGELVGFAHHRRFSSPYTGSTGIFCSM